MKSNCFLRAWEKYLSGEAVWLSFRRSAYSSLYGKIPSPIRVAAYILLWPVFTVYAILHILAFETWPHFVWSRLPPVDAREFVPFGAKSKRPLPPVLFEGYEQPVNRSPAPGKAHTHFGVDDDD